MTGHSIDLRGLQTAGAVQHGRHRACSPTTDISTDLNIDSVAVMDFVMEVEDHFDIEIPLNVLSETRTHRAISSKVVEARTKKGMSDDGSARQAQAIAERHARMMAMGVNAVGLTNDKILSPTRAIINGRETILAGTNNYMGITFDPDCIEAGQEALAEFGTGTTGSRIANGSYAMHTRA